jgi:hypothetical protein
MGMPDEKSTWWNHYKDIRHLPLLTKYIEEASLSVPTLLANGKSFESATIAQLKTFADEYRIRILPGSNKQSMIESNRAANT